MSGDQRDSWNRHEWKADTSWWDDLVVPVKELSDAGTDIFAWLESVAPDPYEHDYVLYTDGSGCTKGWGGYAAVWDRVELQDGYRAGVDTDVLIGGTYGSTVQRSEFNALLDGVHRILTMRCAELKDRALTDDELKWRIGSGGALNQFLGPDRISILWYTDRRNLAASLLFDEDGDPIMARTTERDLWMRWSVMSKHVCVTPMHRPRNVVDKQAVCDKLAGIARQLLKDAEDAMSDACKAFYPTEKWQKIKTQVAQF